MFNKHGRRQRVIKTVSLDVEVAEIIDRLAAQENRSSSNFIETRLLNEMKKERSRVKTDQEECSK